MKKVRSFFSGFMEIGEGEREDGESFKGRTLFDFGSFDFGVLDCFFL